MFEVIFILYPSDHHVWRPTLPGLEGGCRGNQGGRSELPVSIGLPGDGGPRR